MHCDPCQPRCTLVEERVGYQRVITFVRVAMPVWSLDCFEGSIENCPMAGCPKAQTVAAALTLAAIFVLASCSGVSSGPQNQNQNPGNTAGTLAVSPSTLTFRNVNVGSTASLTGTLSATNADVVVSSASWSGSGYAVSGITFPATITAGKAVNYTVTFAPPGAGVSSGSISFLSDASNSPTKQALSGEGTSSAPVHSVALSWNPSTSTVIGYNLYRGTQSGGPYSKLNTSLLAVTSYTDLNVQSGSIYYYVSTAVDSSNLESAYSNEASTAIP